MVVCWHSKLNRTISTRHLNVFQLVEYLHKEQTNMESTIQRAQLGANLPARRRKYWEMDHPLQRLRTRFNAGELTSFEILSAVRHIVQRF
ncbi:hypothetical protein BaRGS_00020594 [Batillaria attramentaria]|uniref:Uncharacterized protein n=1 Tax=Batillaria attramentaria TaxID=370345 RepID=A0ABD0KM38_9CAEN